MLWRGRRESENIEDRRGIRTAGALSGGGLVIAVIYFLITGDPGALIEQVGPASPPPSQATSNAGEPDSERAFVSVILGDTEDVWRKVFTQMHRRYTEPKLVLFNGQVNSACGMASSAVGPFYCPGDQKVYLDLDFFTALSNRLGATGDFAAAYVIAHEVGHHVQNLLGTASAVSEARERLGNSAASNQASVKLELQADCFAGVWAKETERSKQVLESGDIEEAIGAAAAVGDDRLQERSRGRVVPDSFTHGTSAQRVAWFKRGFAAGDTTACDTSAAAH